MSSCNFVTFLHISSNVNIAFRAKLISRHVDVDLCKSRTLLKKICVCVMLVFDLSLEGQPYLKLFPKARVLIIVFFEPGSNIMTLRYFSFL